MTHTVRPRNPELEEYLKENVDNKNDWITEAMIAKMNRETNTEATHELTNRQRDVFRWLCDRLDHGGHISLDEVTNTAAQKTNLSQDLVKSQIVSPLSNKGYIRVVSRLHDVVIKVDTEAGQ